MGNKRLNELIALISKGQFKKLKSKILIKFGSREILFTEFYKTNVWGSAESISGPGSELKYASNIIKLLPALLSKYNIKSINDAPCGDFNYMKEIDLTGIDYTGYDIVKRLIKSNNDKYKTGNIKFQYADVVQEILPLCDLILSRDMFIHFSYEDALKTIKNFKLTGCRYLLTNNYPAILNNVDIKTGSWRPVNLLMEPYCFDEPVEIIEEYNSEEHGVKQLALFKL